MSQHLGTTAISCPTIKNSFLICRKLSETSLKIWEEKITEIRLSQFWSLPKKNYISHYKAHRIEWTKLEKHEPKDATIFWNVFFGSQRPTVSWFLGAHSVAWPDCWRVNSRFTHDIGTFPLPPPFRAHSHNKGSKAWWGNQTANQASLEPLLCS